MKKTLLALCMIVSAHLVYGQASSVKMTKNLNHQIPAARAGNSLPTTASFWTDDFSNAATWVISNDAGNSDNWVIGTGVPSGTFPIPGILSTSAANGFALFDSDLLCSGNQVANLSTASAINCSSEPSVILSFEQMYRRFDDSTFVFVSTDNVSWTKFAVNQNFTNNQTSSNPLPTTVDISSVAASQATVWIRFQFWSPSTYITGPGAAPGCAYAWMIDDVALASGGGGGGTFDDCANAEDINAGFGGAIGTVNTLGPYDNSTATVSPTDPTTGWECFGEPNGSGTAPEINNTVWFTFTGDGNNYFVESGTCTGVTNYIDDGDTQFALYTGSSCTNLTPIKCNEDGPSSGPGGAPPYPAGFTFGTTAGQTYYLMVDGFSFNGAVSTGEFCLLISRVASVACGDPTVSVGTTTASDTILCPGDTVNINVAGAVAPNQGSFYGISMVISSAPITAVTDPLSDPAFIAAYGFVEPVPPTFLRRYVNDGSLIDGVNLPWGTYYWTPVIFGNATPDPNAVQTVFLSDLLLDPACTQVGPSIAVQVLDGTDPLCQTSGIGEVKGQNYGIINLFPVPVRGQLNFVYNSAVTETVQVEVKDQLGRAVKSFSMDVRSGKNDLQADMGGISSGIYFLSVSGKNAVYNTRFTKE